MRAIATPPFSKHYCLFESAFGACGVAWSDQGLTRFQLPEADRSKTESCLAASADGPTPATPPPSVSQAISDLQRYFAGDRVDFNAIALDLTGIAPFHRQVYDASRRIGWGETATYGELARRVGDPGAARAVGQALSRNPIAVIIPCHRILASGNKVGGFSAFGGTVSKERLLRLEGIRLGAAAAAGQLSLFD